MPLARYAVYRGGPQIWVAPTADDSDGWLASMRHIAIESGAFVVSVPQYIPAAAFPSDFPVLLPAGKEIFGRGGAAIVDPAAGEVIAGPLYGEEGMLLADCDLRRGLHAKRLFDAVGHYSREDGWPGATGPAAAGGRRRVRPAPAGPRARAAIEPGRRSAGPPWGPPRHAEAAGPRPRGLRGSRTASTPVAWPIGSRSGSSASR